ncbi:MAG: ParA family protein, partial [Deltaproteobacteria bacterium]|nr:ParA family protein [Deltaproteobacteria bacterium]
GTCKTTLAVNLGAWLAREKNRKTLIVDLDTQGHCGKSLGVDVRQAKRTVLDLLVDPAVSAQEVVVPTAVPNLSLLPSNKSLADFPLKVANDADRERKLQSKLEGLTGYDFVLFDAPPSMGLVTTNIFLATSEVVVPVALTYLAMDGCAEVLATVERMRQQYAKPDLSVTMVVPTLYRRTALADEILSKLGSYFPDALCKTALGYNVKIDEAQSHGRTIWEYAPDSRGAEMLGAIAKELLRRGERSAHFSAVAAS